MKSSGTTAMATTDDNPITLLTDSGGNAPTRATIVNESLVQGFVSIDGGSNWEYLPAANSAGPASRTFAITDRSAVVKIMVKRVPSGSNLTGLYADTE